MLSRISVLVLLLPGVLLLGSFSGCKPEVTGGELENISPTVRLPNSMADSMYLPSTSLIKWIGDDADGVVVGYSLRIDGGTWSGGRHVRGDGYRRDCEKLNAATLAGWRVLRFVGRQVKTGEAIETVQRALGAEALDAQAKK